MITDALMKPLYIALALVAALAFGFGTYKVVGWQMENTYLHQLDESKTTIINQNTSILTLTQNQTTLQAAIERQNHAVELAEERTRSAEQQQALAKAALASQVKQSDARIASLLKDLNDVQVTLGALLRKNWEATRHE
ncbi:hypothetical protein BJP27_24155 (plasmid) [Pseudomonas oryzihabitans]|nr:hypothetical protein BJP27_24155 [Pseudomonas psychrotolerans]